MKGKLKKLEKMAGIYGTVGYYKHIFFFVTRCWDENGQIYYMIDDHVRVESLDGINEHITKHCERYKPRRVSASYQILDCEFICSKEEDVEGKLVYYLRDYFKYEDGNCRITASVSVGSPYEVIRQLYQGDFDEDRIARCIEAHYDEDWRFFYTWEEIEKIWNEIRMEFSQG